DVSGRTSCGINVTASVDFGTGPTNPATSPLAAKVTATVNATTAALGSPSYDAATDSWRWSTTGFPFSVPVNAGGNSPNYPITINWEEQSGSVTGKGTCTNKGNNPCKGSFANVQRVTSATDVNDGPVKLVQLAEPSNANGDAPYSLQAGTHTLTI